jgi:putative ATP-dependent endonuclease of OLD family
MHLASLTIENFRCFGSPGTTFEFKPGINVVIGENNVGKTALIDALRILFSMGLGRRDVYLSSADFHCGTIGDSASEIKFDAVFEGLTEDEQGAFYELLAASPSSTAQLHVRFVCENINGQQRIRPKVWGGELEGQSVTGMTYEAISHIYLGALRDAESDLGPGRGSRLAQLVRRVITEDGDRERILEHARMANREILRETGVQKAAETINEHLRDLTGESLRQTIRVGFMPPIFERVTEALRPLLPHGGGTSFLAVYDDTSWGVLRDSAGEHATILERMARREGPNTVLDLGLLTKEEQDLLGNDLIENLTAHVFGDFAVEQNGMGYNNLIYMGVVLGDLVERRRADMLTYNALLIEEPEAHLHPQLQVLVYDFLDRTSVVDEDGVQVQVFITSHSPTLTSRAALDSIVVIHRSAGGTLKATAVRRCPLTAANKQDLERYLDVTRSQLFFARGVLLVEGISEALVLPALAHRSGRRLDHAAVEIVSVSGVSFEPFAKLFNSPDPGRRLDIPCVIITDDDRCSEKNDVNRILANDSLEEKVRKLRAGEASARCKRTQALAGGQVKVNVARKTFEFELALHGENVACLLDAIDAADHPQIARDLRDACQTLTDDWERATASWTELRDIKAEVAQRLATILSEHDDGAALRRFAVPEYIAEALKHAVPISKVKDNTIDASPNADAGTI